MPGVRRRFLVGLVLLLAAGLGIGWLYDRPLAGLLVASLLALAQIVRQLLRFERALRLGRLEPLAYGDGIWSQLASRVVFLKQRSRKHKRRHRQLLKEVRNSTNAMPDGGIVLNSDLEIVLANMAAQALAGIRMPQDRGQRVDNFLRNPEFVAWLESDDHSRPVEIAAPGNEGGWLSCQLVPFGADQFLLLVRDVTESVRLNRTRRDFVANASHELRSPLTVIAGYLDTLSADESLAEEWQKPLKQMRTQAERMNRVVAELLELSRLETPGSEREEQDVDVAALFALTRRAWSGQPNVASIHCETPLTARLRGVSGEIESIVSNLVANAIRHTPADGRITLSWKSDPSGGATLSVEDTGEGIAGEHLPRLTERFFRVDEGRSREAGGVGLGLAIVKHALLRHDATLEIDSTLGEGSRFSCRFPASRIVSAGPVPIRSANGSGA